MGTRFEAVAPPTVEVPMVEAEAVRQMRELAASGWERRRSRASWAWPGTRFGGTCAAPQQGFSVIPHSSGSTRSATVFPSPRLTLLGSINEARIG